MNFKEINKELTSKAAKDTAQRVLNNLASISKGNYVMLERCYLARVYEGQVFKVLCDPVKIYKCYYVKLERLGLFNIGFVKKI